MDELLKLEMDLMTSRRKGEVIDACEEMRKKKLFGNIKKKKKMKFIAECEVCGKFTEFFVYEITKVCKECDSEGKNTKQESYLEEENRMQRMLKLAKDSALQVFKDLVKKIHFNGDK